MADSKPQTSASAEPDSKPPVESKYLLDENNRVILCGGRPILDLRKNVDVVEGLIPGTVDLIEVDEYGASGDVFDHSSWRDIFITLWSVTSCKKQMLALITDLFIRGKENKIQNKGKVISYRVRLPPGLECPKLLNLLTNGKTVFDIKINYASSESRVGSSSLTPERLKCVLRSIVVPMMRKTGRLSAVSEALGYAELVRSLIVYENKRAQYVREGLEEKDRLAIEQDESFKHWSSIAAVLQDDSIFLNSTAAIAGSISTKEIYKEDEDTFPGCIWWSGVHSMMTDAANRIRAPSVPSDQRSRLENSSFYSDFKRKMIARGVVSLHTTGYIRFLSQVCSGAKKFIRVGTSMSSNESGVMDDIVGTAITTAKMQASLVIGKLEETHKVDEGPARVVITTTDPKELEDAIDNHAKVVAGQTGEAAAEVKGFKTMTKAKRT